MTEEEIEDMDKEIKKEEEDPDSPMNDEDEEDDNSEQEQEQEPAPQEEEFKPVEMSIEDKNLISKMTSLIDNVELDNEEEE